MKLSTILVTLQVLLATTGFAKTLQVPGDHPSIQTAINASEEGDRIMVAPGTYRERLVLKANLSLIGTDENPELTVIDGSGKDGAQPGVMMAEGALLKRFTVTGVGDYDEALWKTHWEERGENQKHGDIGVFGVPAIAADGVSCRIEGCIVRHNGHTGIALRGRNGMSVDPVVIGNRCFRNMGGGIGIMDGAAGIVKGNTCYENFLAGIGHSGNAAPLVIENDCHDNVRAGIGVSEGACPVVRGNRCHANRRAGIGIRSGATTRPVVEDNECNENGMAGIGVEDGAEPILRNNHCEENALAGIGAQGGAKPLLVANTCRRNAASGIGLRAGCEAILWRNVCDANALVALGLPEKARAILVENTFLREGGMPPLVAIKGGSEAIFHGNQLTGGGVAAVLVEGRAVFVGNAFQGMTGKSGNGIWLWKGSSAFGAENTFEGFKSPLTVADDARWLGEKP